MKQQQRWFFPLALLLSVSVLITPIVLADDLPASGADIDELDIKDNDNSAFFKWLPGETYDPRTATLGYYVTDLHAEGTGLDIAINRKFYMPIEPFTTGSGYPKSFGSMQLDTPRLEYTTWKKNDSTLKCSGLVLSKQRQDPSGAITISGTGLTFHADNRAIKFFPKSLGYSESRFPSNAVYVSSNNWYIDCNGTTFRVHRPNGVVYHLNVHEYYKTNYLKLRDGGFVVAKAPATKKTVYVSKIIDPYNNTLTYSYVNKTREWIGKTFTQKVLVSILASDGRKVTINRRDPPHKTEKQKMFAAYSKHHLQQGSFQKHYLSI